MATWITEYVPELKETTLDVRAKDKRGITFIVEMQVERQEFFGKRVLYYSSKAYVSQIDKAMDYPKLNQVIFIGILDFDFFSGSDYLSRHLILNKENFKQELTDLEFNFIELTKFNKGENDLKDIVDKWVYFVKNAENLDVIPQSLQSLKEIRDAFEAANRFNWTKEEVEIYDYWEMDEAGHNDAENTARNEGIKKGKHESLELMIASGISEDEAQKILNLS